MTGSPKLGASARRTLRGMAAAKTLPGKCLRTSWATWEEKFVLPSNMVSSTPKMDSDGLSRRFTARMVDMRSDRPSSA